MHSSEVIPPSVCRLEGLGNCRRGTLSMASLGSLHAAFQRAPLHVLLVSRSYITHDEAISTFLQWMVAAA